MLKKLTLTLDTCIIEQAKKYARKNHISLSKLVEFYLKTIIKKSKLVADKIPPITNELTGIAEVQTDKSEKELLVEALLKRYMK